VIYCAIIAAGARDVNRCVPGSGVADPLSYAQGALSETAHSGPKRAAVGRVAEPLASARRGVAAVDDDGLDLARAAAPECRGLAVLI
jgi:hypothetical protein